jgi:acylphosphatase
MADICMHLVISGRVQGVWFRRFTQEQAQANNVSGWVRNLSDGRVEALLCGDERSVRHVEAWLNRGPELANVTHVAADPCPYEPFSSFDVLDDGG